MLIELREQFERFVNILLVFGFNGAKYDLNFIMSWLTPLHANEKEFELSVNKISNQFVFFKFGNIHYLYNMKFLGATSYDVFLEAYKTRETKNFFPFSVICYCRKTQASVTSHIWLFSRRFCNDNPQ